MSHSLGEPYDLGLTMVAIAMRESNLGEVMINLTDPSSGTHHVTIDKAIKKLGWNDTGYNRNRATQLMMTDLAFGAKLGLETLLWWNDYHDGNWRLSVSSYNGGFKGNPTYVKHIVKNIDTIRECGWLNRSEV